MTNFKKFNFNIPHLWQKEWEQAISETADPERQILINQTRSANMLRTINDFEASPERLAWLTIWTKTFTALDGAIGALSRNSLFLLNIISRCVFEGSLHIEIILEPASKLFNLKSSHHKVSITKSSEKFVFNQSIDRLRAYTAWCLWNDKQFYKELYDHRTLNGIWAPKPAMEILTDQNKREVHERFFRPLDLEIDKQVLDEDRKEMKKHIQTKMELLEGWLEDPILSNWYKKIEKLAQQYHGSIPFFAIFEETTTSIAKRLNKIGLRFGYSSYMQGSMLMHGSTVDQVLRIDGSNIFPMFIGADSECKTAALFVADNCNDILLKLELLKRILWDGNSF